MSWRGCVCRPRAAAGAPEWPGPPQARTARAHPRYLLLYAGQFEPAAECGSRARHSLTECAVLPARNPHGLWRMIQGISADPPARERPWLAGLKGMPAWAGSVPRGNLTQIGRCNARAHRRRVSEANEGTAAQRRRPVLRVVICLLVLLPAASLLAGALPDTADGLAELPPSVLTAAIPIPYRLHSPTQKPRAGPGYTGSWTFSYRNSGAKSAPFGQQSVRNSGCTANCLKTARSFRGSNSSP